MSLTGKNAAGKTLELRRSREMDYFMAVFVPKFPSLDDKPDCFSCRMAANALSGLPFP